MLILGLQGLSSYYSNKVQQVNATAICICSKVIDPYLFKIMCNISTYEILLK